MLKNITSRLLSQAVQDSMPDVGLVPTYQNYSVCKPQKMFHMHFLLRKLLGRTCMLTSSAYTTTLHVKLLTAGACRSRSSLELARLVPLHSRTERAYCEILLCIHAAGADRADQCARDARC